MRLVLVHSPAVGPSTWRWTAVALRAAGHDVSVPDLRAAASTGDLAAYVAAASSAAATPAPADVVVGHSGAGPSLPAIVAAATALPARRPVFVDAGLPADGPDPFLPRLRSLAVDGVLPPWSTWFGPDALAAMVPDADRRAAVRADEPRVPLALYEAGPPAAPLPADAAYVLLSEPYRPDAERAAALGWTVVEHPGTHLGIVSDPDGVAAAILAVLG